MEEVRPGIWHWTAPHPAWKPGYDWPRDVSSFAIDDGEQLLVFDPIAPSHKVDALAQERTASILLTCPWHARDGADLAHRLDASVYVPPPDDEDDDGIAGIVYRAGDTLPTGLVAHAGAEPNDLVLWMPSRGALIVGDTLIDRGAGLEFPRDWSARGGLDPDVVLEGLQPLLDLPVECVLATHGGMFDGAAFVDALS